MTGQERIEKPLVVVVPDVLARSFFDQASHQVLEFWGEGIIRLALNRSLLIRYLRILNRLGLPPGLIHWWSWWFTAPQKVHYLENGGSKTDPGRLCSECARLAGAEAVIFAGPDGITKPETDSTTGLWIPVSDFLKKMAPSENSP